MPPMTARSPAVVAVAVLVTRIPPSVVSLVMFLAIVVSPNLLCCCQLRVESAGRPAPRMSGAPARSLVRSRALRAVPAAVLDELDAGVHVDAVFDAQDVRALDPEHRGFLATVEERHLTAVDLAPARRARPTRAPPP